MGFQKNALESYTKKNALTLQKIIQRLYQRIINTHMIKIKNKKIYSNVAACLENISIQIELNFSI